MPHYWDNPVIPESSMGAIPALRSAKHNIATYNVNSVVAHGRREEVERWMDKHNIKIACIQETKTDCKNTANLTACACCSPTSQSSALESKMLASLTVT